MRRLCIVPRWAADQGMEWYPWLRGETAVRDAFAHVAGPDIEDRGTPTVAAWVASLDEACDAGTESQTAEALAATWFVGHSVGCQAILHYVAGLPSGTTVGGILAVAGWWTVDEPWDTIRPWLHAADALDTDRISAACSRLRVLISNDDPFTADWRTTRALWQQRLGAEVTVIPGAKHFNVAEAPAVRDALLSLVG